MKGTLEKSRSWEKQSFYMLENGLTVVIECNPTYGEMVTSVIDADNILWHCSRGTPPPSFMADWVEKVLFYNLVRPKFEKVYV